MNTVDDIKQIFYSYEIAGLIEQDPIKVLSYLSEDIIGIGMGEQGYISSKKEVRDIMLATIKKDLDATYSLEFENELVNLTSSCTANACGNVFVKRCFQGKVTTSGFMQSLSFVLREGKWYICALHASPITLTEESVESYPLSFAENAIMKLKAELRTETFAFINQNFSGGILGTYATAHYPLFFVNDPLIKILGYERTEFEALFQKATDVIIHFEDLAYMREKINETVRQAQDLCTRIRLRKKDGNYIWTEIRLRLTKDEEQNDILMSVITDVSEIVRLQMEAHEQNETILSSLVYAKKIQENLLVASHILENTFTDYSVLWQPKDIVGGDIYWIKNFPSGTFVCLCDCTGHGVPGALLTMMVTSIFEAAMNESNCHNTALAIWELDRQIANSLHAGAPLHGQENRLTQILDGCDLATLFVANDGSITLSSSNIHVFICDGSQVKQMKGQRLSVGEGFLPNIECIKTIKIDANPNNKFYIASDGLYNQIGTAHSRPFGYKAFKDLILKHHEKTQAEITTLLWTAFEAHRSGYCRQDDVTLLTFKP